MKGFFLIVILLILSGCAQWNELSDQEKGAIIVSGAILVGASIIKNSNDDTIVNKTCVSTRSIRTGCGDVSL